LDVPRSITESYKIWIALGGVVLALVWPWLSRRGAAGALAMLVLAAGLNYARWGPDAIARRLDAYDLLHYYVNAKYFDELGYYDLYPAVLLVDARNGGPFFDQGATYQAQDETGHHVEPIEQGLARGEVVRSERFTPERWDAFTHDVLTLQRTIGCRDRSSRGRCIRELDDELWRQMIHDHGFNGTPAWVLVARPLTIVPVEALKVLAWLDVVLLGGAVALVAWAYGGVSALWLTLWLLVTYSTRWPTLTWAFLRYDWVAALIAATALLRKGRPLLAGLLGGWAAVSRLFPALWMWGPASVWVLGLLRGVRRGTLVAMGVGFVVTVLVAEGAALGVLGVDTAATHLENMEDHTSAEQLSSRRIGLALALATEPWRGTNVPEIITKEHKQAIDRQASFRYAIAAVILLALAWGLRRSRDDETFAYGFFPFFLVTTASYYYYVARAPLIALHAGEIAHLRHRLSLAYLFGIEVFCNAAETMFPGHRLFLIGTLAWLIGGYVVATTAALVAEAEGLSAVSGQRSARQPDRRAES
jgi:hypothetical protein